MESSPVFGFCLCVCVGGGGGGGGGDGGRRECFEMAIELGLGSM